MQVSAELHAPAAVTRGNSLHYLLDRRLGGHQNRSGGGSEEEKNPFITPTRNRNPIVQPVP
jgi:hypothetical protein